MLPADVCRCHDDTCPDREQCRRWVERNTGNVHAQSLNPYAVDSTDRCKLFEPLQADD